MAEVAPSDSNKFSERQLIGLVEGPSRHTPDGEVDSPALLLPIERRCTLGRLEGRTIVVINPKVEPGVLHHSDHDAIAERASLVEQAARVARAEARQDCRSQPF